MRFRARLANCFIAKIDQFLIKKNRLDIPDSFPGNDNIAFFGELLAGGFCFA